MSSITLEGIEGSGELWLDIVKIICGDANGKSMLDAGCYKAPHTPKLGFSERVYVDVQDRPLDFPDEQKYFVHSDMVEYLHKCERNFDVIVSSDSLEHLGFNTAVYFINLMGQKSKKQIVFTPLGPLNHSDDQHPDSHKSWWWPGDFPEWGIVIFPNFHPDLKCGAFFAYNCDEKEKQRIHNEIKQKYVESRID